jgi:hypothetical protein
MKCPKGHEGAQLKTPDYGYGYGAEFVCYQCYTYGQRFTTRDLAGAHRVEGEAISAASLATSRANRDLVVEALKQGIRSRAPQTDLSGPPRPPSTGRRIAVYWGPRLLGTVRSTVFWFILGFWILCGLVCLWLSFQ